MNKLNVLIGRFQTPELSPAHLHIIRTLGFQGDFMVLLGVSPMDGREHRHPLTFRQRASMVEETCKGWDSHFKGVFPIFDQHSDELWSRLIDEFLSRIAPESECKLVGGRDSFIPHYKGKLKILEFDPFNTRITGSQMRAQVKLGMSSTFRAGQIYAIENQFPRVFPTVDIGVMRPIDPLGADIRQILLIRRADTGQWCLPGGFVDPSDPSFLAAAQRELSEEVGINLTVTQWKARGTFPIDDWRYKGSRDKIITSLFKCDHQWGIPILTPEVIDFHWLSLTHARGCITPQHLPLVETLFK